MDVEPSQIETDLLTEEESRVPDWIGQTIEWWLSGEVPEDQFLEGIKWMIKNKVIKGV